MLTIDGQSYNVDVVSVKRKGDFLDKFAERTEAGVLERELIGAYFNYQLKLGPNADAGEYDRLWEKLTEAEEFHTVEVPYGAHGIYSFRAYFSDVADELLCRQAGTNRWHNLTVNFTSKAPAKT
nr:MAG TPA: hypothetical protein [Caudoviricetes sp.]